MAIVRGVRRSARGFLRAVLPLVLALFAAAPGVGAESASAVAASFNEALLASMRNADSLGYAARYEQLRPRVLQTFDIPFMAEKVLGRRWGELSEQDRERWRAVFGDLLTATYAGRFVGYRGQTFQTVGEEPAARDTVLVLTRLDDPKGDDVVINYRLRRADGEWKVVDIYLKGTVSELALRRSEYSAVLERDGFPALLEAVRAKIGALERGEDK